MIHGNFEQQSFRSSGTWLIQELRHAYREWDAGRMTDDQYNAEAHRIEGIEARLETAGMISMNLIDKFHDLYAANAYAVNN